MENIIFIEKALPGLHNYLYKIVKSIVNQNQYKYVLDLGCGSGAFAKRLKEDGLQIECADIEEEDFKLKDIKFYKADLNDPSFSEIFKKKYDLILSVEVIEHLHNPFNFLKNLSYLIKEKGAIILTTPNVDSIANRLKFLLTGEIRLFEKSSDPNHFTPIFHNIFVEKFLPQVNLKIANYYSFPEKGFYCSRRWIKVFYKMIALLPIFKGNKYGDISIYHLIKA